MIILLCAGIVGLVFAGLGVFTLLGVTTSNFQSITEIIVGGGFAVFSVIHIFFWLPFLEIRKLRREKGDILRKMEKELRPALRYSSGKAGDGSVSRDWAVSYDVFSNLGGQNYVSGRQFRLTDFFGVTIINDGIETVQNFSGCITKVVRLGDAEPIWTRHITLSFEPWSITEKEPVEFVKLRKGVPQAVCLCSVDDRKEVMPSSVNMTSRYAGHFEKALKEPGAYIIHVRFFADNIDEISKQYLFTWAGDRTKSNICEYHES